MQRTQHARQAPAQRRAGLLLDDQRHHVDTVVRRVRVRHAGGAQTGAAIARRSADPLGIDPAAQLRIPAREPDARVAHTRSDRVDAVRVQVADRLDPVAVQVEVARHHRAIGIARLEGGEVPEEIRRIAVRIALAPVHRQPEPFAVAHQHPGARRRVVVLRLAPQRLRLPDAVVDVVEHLPHLRQRRARAASVVAVTGERRLVDPQEQAIAGDVTGAVDRLVFG